MDDRSSTPDQSAALEPQPSESRLASASPSSRPASWPGVALAVTGVASITFLAALRVIPPEEWRWTVGGVVACVFQINPLRFLRR